MFEFDHTAVKLGKAAPKFDKRTLQLAKYINKSTIPTPPIVVDWMAKVTSPGMMGNDRYGDCTCAAAGHLLQQQTVNATGVQITPTDTQVLAMYSGVTSPKFNSKTGANDNGADELACLKFMKNKGIAGHRIGGWAGVSLQDLELVQTALWLFGGLYTGVALPVIAQAQVAAGLWDITKSKTGKAAPGSWGGHAVTIGRRDAKAKKLRLWTWGQGLDCTDAFWLRYFDEAHAVFSVDWLKGTECPAGFDKDQLLADLSVVGTVNN